MSVTLTDIGTHSGSTYYTAGDYSPPDSAWVLTKILPTEIDAVTNYQGTDFTLWLKGNFDLTQLPANATTMADLPKTGSTLFTGVGIKDVFTYAFSSPINNTQLNLLMNAQSNADYATVYSSNDVYINSAGASFDNGSNNYYLYAGDDTLYQNHHLLKYADVFHGGAGSDTLVLTNNSTNFKIQTSNYVWDELTQTSHLAGFYVTDNTGQINTTQIEQVEQIQFGDTTLQTKWFSEAQSLAQTSPAQFTTLTEMYIAYFNRAPDAVGLDYWASTMYEGQTFSQVARNFFTAPETIAAFGTISSTSSVTDITNFVNGVYQNVLNRASDSGGLVYWVVQLSTGAIAPGDFILNIINAVNGQTGTADKTYVTSKEAVGAHFAITDGLTNTVQAHNVINTFNTTFQTSGATAAITAANAISDGYLSHLGTSTELVVQLVGVNV